MTKKKKNTATTQNDPTAVSRKRDHIELAFSSQVGADLLDERFYYEPLLAAHQDKSTLQPFDFLAKKMQVPLWVSSMTGGTEWAHIINHNLARACKNFGMGMGLGSCRSLLFNDEHLSDFNVRSIIGDELPLFANLGIAQVEQLIENNRLERVSELLDKLFADGLIIHVNPLQEAMQPEGDILKKSPLETIRAFLDRLPDVKVIVKEVGQGMGYESLEALFKLPLEAVDFAASGGTNFALLELLRSDESRLERFGPLTHVGHSAEEMVEMTNRIHENLGPRMLCKQVIISGGIKNFLDGYYLLEKIKMPAVYGRASGFLKYARGDYQELHDYVSDQVKGLQLAKAYLRVR